MENQNNLKYYDLKFSVTHLKKLVDKTTNENQLCKAYAYIKKFFFKYKTDYFFFDSEIYELYKRDKAMELIPDDIKKTYRKIECDDVIKTDVIIKNYLKKTDMYEREYKPVVDFSKPQIFSNKQNIRGIDIKYYYVNMGKPLPYNISNENIEITKIIEKDVKLIDEFILNVLCSGDKLQYEYLLNFFACTFGGRKLRKAVYWQTKERTGKGTIMNFLNNILGKRMYKTNSVEDVMKYKKPFEGCCLINMDELPVEGQWKSISDVLKGLVTEPTFNCRNMYEAGYI
jgi:hypothetical protein